MKIAVIGAGNMGGAIVRGLASRKGLNCGNIAVSNPSAAKLEDINASWPEIYTSTSNVDVLAGADLIILAVKPWKIKEVIDEIGPHADWSCQMLMSLAAGVSLDDLGAMLSPYAASSPVLFRCIPNTAISVGASMTFIVPRGASDDETDDVRMLFDRLGATEVIEERLVDAATALCSCGIAYVMRYLRASVEGAVELGMSPQSATRSMIQTMAGAARMLAATGEHPEAEIDRVTTPGGLTIRGLNAMEAAGFTPAVIAALKASV